MSEFHSFEEVIIDYEEISDFFQKELIKKGFVPTEEEVTGITDIIFDYLLKKCFLED